jgi:acyl-CoA thioesterase I
MSTLIEDHAVVLFQGDSITDAGWDRKWPDVSLGCGYAMITAAWFGALFPEKRVRFLNRGISGNRAKDLVARWDQDCLALKPTWVSIMIGINDTWRRYDSNEATTTADYEAACRDILTRARQTLKARIILIEPFVLPVPEDRKRWREDLDPRIAVVHKLAREFGALLVRMDAIFAEAALRREPAFWAADGVHPSPAGHALIAQSWLKAVKAL